MDPQFHAACGAVNMIPTFMKGDAFHKFLEAKQASLAKVVKEMNLAGN